MTNQNHKLSKERKKKKTCKTNVIREERRERMYGNVIALVISGLALLVSSLSLATTIYFSNKEYEYKVEPEVVTRTQMAIEAYEEDGKHISHFYSSGISIELLDKNNLQKAYLIYADNRVEKLNVNEEQGTLEEKLNERIKTDKYNLKVGDRTYQYWFLFLVSLDGSSNMTLIYTKSDGEEFTFDEVSGVEVWGLTSSNKSDPEYEGERIMAEHYLKILEESAEYIL